MQQTKAEIKNGIRYDITTSPVSNGVVLNIKVQKNSRQKFDDTLNGQNPTFVLSEMALKEAEAINPIITRVLPTIGGYYEWEGQFHFI